MVPAVGAFEDVGAAGIVKVVEAVDSYGRIC